jgi:plasmid stabilization system protein ParE
VNLIFHRGVQKDVTAIMVYYDQVGGKSLGDSFFNELMAHIQSAQNYPTRFHPVGGGLRRVNLVHFPYHFLFRIVGNTMRILVVRHHQRHPTYGETRR